MDLQDKMFTGDAADLEKVKMGGNTLKAEALSALSSLGFDKKKAEKTLNILLTKEGDNIGLEKLIKLALKQL